MNGFLQDRVVAFGADFKEKIPGFFGNQQGHKLDRNRPFTESFQ